MKFLVLFVNCLLFVLAAGCAQNQHPDFDRLYEKRQSINERLNSNFATTPPVIVIPGLFGSRLIDRDTGEEIWPGKASKLIFGQYRDLEMAIYAETLTPKPSQLIPGGITETAVGQDFYGRLLNTLQKYGGYQPSELNHVLKDPTERRLYIFDYDWRQDNVVTAGLFADFIQQIRMDYANPNLKVDIIAHSMGGLMARYYLRYGRQDVLNDNKLKVTWAGASTINKMILLGTPNLGSLSSIEGFIRGQKVGLGRIPRDVVATMPATYQMFPHRIVKWLYDNNGQPIDRDQFDVNTWRTLQWNIFAPEFKNQLSNAKLSLLERYFERYSERARRFSWSLTICPNYSSEGCPAEISEPPVRLVVFGGNCTLTPARLVLEEPDDGSTIRFTPASVKDPNPEVNYKKLMMDPGDGTVTKPSLLGRDALEPHTPRHEYSYFPLAYSFMLCEKHSTLTSNIHFEDNLLDVLLTRARPWELHKDHGFSRKP